MIRHGFSRPAPHVPVESVRNRLCGELPFPRTGIVVGDDFGDFPETTFANEFAAAVILPRGTLLAAHLEDAVVFACRLRDQSSFANRQRQWLFCVDIFARLTGMHADQEPPMFGCGGDHGVHVLAFKQPAIILKGDGFVPGCDRFRAV